MSANQTIVHILSAKKCGDLFSFDAATAKLEYKTMAKEIHPDLCDDQRADEAMRKLNELYNRAEECFAGGYSWEATNKVWIAVKNYPKKQVSISYQRQDSFEFGQRYVCKTAVAYVFSPGTEKYWKNALKMMQSIKYANERMRQEMKRFMPEVKISLDTEDGGHMIVIGKTEDVLPLDLFLEKYQEGINDRHATWMVSRLCNLACFFSYNGLSYNAFAPANLFVSPQFHSICALGGWWYAAPIGCKMIGAPRAVYEQMPEYVRFEKVGAIVTDLESIKEIARNLFKSASRSVPKPIDEWTQSGSSESAVKEYKRWSDAVDKSYGERRFIKFDIDIEHFYE